MSSLPCKNPACSSHGQPHPNCRCYMAAGGKVKNFCEQEIPHQPDCQYFAGGGMAATPEPIPQPVHSSVTLGHAAVHHGLLGILRDVGGQSLSHPEKHQKTFEKVRQHMATGQNEKAIDSLQDHPLVGRAARGKVETIVHRLAPEVTSRESNPSAFRSAADYLHSSMKGNDALEKHFRTFFEPQKASEKLKPDVHKRKELDDFLKSTQENPQALLEVGGSLGHYLPDHAAAVGSLAAQSADYLNTMRPKAKQINPLDRPIPPDESAAEQFNRHLDVAQNPMLVLQHARNGTLLPSDLGTLKTLYPALHKSMTEKATEALIEAKTKGKQVPYHQAVSLGQLLGQSMESTMVPSSLQAIIHANGAGESQQSQQPQKKMSQGKPTAAELKQIDKVDSMYQTPLERRQFNRK